MTGIPTSIGDAFNLCTPLKEFNFSCYQELLDSYQVCYICCYESSISNFERIYKKKFCLQFKNLSLLK